MSSSNYKWGTDTQDGKPMKVVLFVSRNKDNKGVADYKERRKSFVTTKDWEDLIPDFERFKNDGVVGEMSRMYISVNARNNTAVHKELLHFLIDNPDFNLAHLSSKIAGIAAKKECVLEKKWMFDFDIDAESAVDAFCDDINAIANPKEAATEEIKTIMPITINLVEKVVRTPHGYAVITTRGFDTRELFKKWNPEEVTLKRDDLLCVAWGEKEE